ncbi:hypothetical protein ACK32U_20855 [Aeromonas dhakensis]|uniref:hypothetical protein n=1 Tax=Aeromonas TaxID=642 RepID=UPI0018A75595|nr:hypothetical protein [Aeromonas dhakensis]MBF8448314.1 hypothetical protein [Aeromonas dhakensis]WAF73334.1 hypothetical protein NRK99_03330 [Aeromonas dhakensis]
MDPSMRKRYEVVRVQDLVDYYAEKGVNPSCSLCKSTFFNIETIDAPLSPSEDGSDPEYRKQMAVCEMHGPDNTWACYPLSCENCGTFLNVDAEKILVWTEEKRLKKVDEGVTSGDASESNA